MNEFRFQNMYMQNLYFLMPIFKICSFVYLRDITCNYNYWSIWENQNVLGIQVLFFMGIRITYIQEREAFYENSGSSFPINVRICVISSKFVGREAMPTLKKQPPSKQKKNLRNILKKKKNQGRVNCC